MTAVGRDPAGSMRSRGDRRGRPVDGPRRSSGGRDVDGLRIGRIRGAKGIGAQRVHHGLLDRSGAGQALEFARDQWLHRGGVAAQVVGPAAQVVDGRGQVRSRIRGERRDLVGGANSEGCRRSPAACRRSGPPAPRSPSGSGSTWWGRASARRRSSARAAGSDPGPDPAPDPVLDPVPEQAATARTTPTAPTRLIDPRIPMWGAHVPAGSCGPVGAVRRRGRCRCRCPSTGTAIGARHPRSAS